MNGEVVAVCGLLCSECDTFLATQAADGARIESLAREASAKYGVAIAADSMWCAGCVGHDTRKSWHTGGCEIRVCAIDRDLETCADCTHYTCEKLDAFLDKTAHLGTRERLEAMRPIF
jgi:hypothetical protein